MKHNDLHPRKLFPRARKQTYVDQSSPPKMSCLKNPTRPPSPTASPGPRQGSEWESPFTAKSHHTGRRLVIAQSAAQGEDSCTLTSLSPFLLTSYERTPATRSFFRIPPAPLRRGRGVPRAKHPGHGPRNRGVALDLTRLVKKEQTREKE